MYHAEPQHEGGNPPLAPDFIEQDYADEIDNAVPTRGYQMTPMVGLGGSAGSISALQDFFRAMPPDTGSIFAVVLHLSPTHASTLPELLQAVTKMTVAQAEDGQRVEKNHVYVIPPGKYLATVNGHLKLTELEGERGKRVAIDFFFRSLADTHSPHAVAIVLSGADGDGAIGIKRIKERGGLTIAQDPDQAEYSTMPRAAIETGMVDGVLDVRRIPEQTAGTAGRAENERWHVRKYGSRFYGSGLVMPLRDAAGRVGGFGKIMRDLTDRKRVQEELHEQMEELTRFNEAAVGRELRMIELQKGSRRVVRSSR
ncbi:MAG: PAS domain S-box protein [Planctomycetaceae bacterium]|nr:PAS domain S-box protein [Planctomycetaceae bacterium]